MKGMKALVVALLALCLAGAGYVLYLQIRSDSMHGETPAAGDGIAERASQEPGGPAKSSSAEPTQTASSTTGAPEGTVHVFGTVLDADTNAPIAQAIIKVAGALEGAETSPLPETRSDEKGAFALDVTAGTYAALACTAPGYQVTKLDLIQKAGTTIRLDFLLRPGSSVAGKVLDASSLEPIEDARVRLVGTQETLFDRMREFGERTREPLAATTQPDGTYRIEGIPSGAFRLVVDVRESGYLFPPEDAIPLDVQPGTDYSGMDFSLTKGGVVEGTVTDASGAPVPEIEVMCVPTQMFRWAMRKLDTMDPRAMEPPDSTTDASGAFRITGLDFDVELRVVASPDTYSAAQSEAFTLTAASPSTKRDLVVARGSNVSGVATFSDGTPASEIHLMLFPAEGGGGWGPFMRPGMDETDEAGAFTIEHVPAGTYRLRAIAGERRGPFAEEESGLTVEVDGTKDVTGIKLTVEKEEPESSGEGVLTGVVIGVDGAPLPEVHVDAKRTDNPRETYGATTDAAGRFALSELRGFAFDVLVDNEAGMARKNAVPVGSDIELRLEPPGIVGGLVVDTEGEAVAGASVQLKAEGESLEDSVMTIVQGLFNQTPGGETTDAYGRFEFQKVAPGTYTVTAESSGQGSAVSESLTIGPGTEITNLHLVLDPGVTFSGIVVGPAGEPVRGASVQLVPEGANSTADMVSQFLPSALLKTAGSTNSGASGEFTIARVPAGTYRLVATHSEYAKTTIAGIQIAAGADVSGYRVAMGKGGRARGMFTVEGKPQAGAMVFIIGASGFEMTQTDEQGMFDVQGLPSGSYMVSAFSPAQMARQGEDFQFKPQVIDITDGQIADVEIGGGGGASVGGTITGARGGVTVVALRKLGGPSIESMNITDMNSVLETMRSLAGQTMVGEDGSFTLEDVTPGEYVLEVYSFDVDQQNLDPLTLMSMPRTPAHRQNVTVGEGAPALEIVLDE
ncbi:MAG: carboxypeptidase regulatory-like domain-containing protein [Candidatus Hydrogenedentes bacterium]|nr:carboxypeptidase regulatory-like domain-containing protein [Candidatus Hydrogenedentota bacterium]